MSSPFNRAEVFGNLAEKLTKNIAKDPELMVYLKNSFLPMQRDYIIGALQGLLPKEYCMQVKDVWSGLLTHCKWVVLHYIWQHRLLINASNAGTILKMFP